MIRTVSCLLSFCLLVSSAMALPVGYKKTTIPVNASPTGLAFSPDGTLYAFEAPPFSVKSTVVRVINPDLTFGTDIPVTGLDDDNFFIGSMAYDHVTSSLLITDNAGSGALYSVTPLGVQTTIFNNVANVAGVAVRSTGEIFVSTAPSAGDGKVYQVDRGTGAVSEVLSGLGFGAGLAFDSAGNLIVQDAQTSFPYMGKLQRLPISEDNGNLIFGAPELLLANLAASAGVAIDSEGDFFVTGSGGVFEISGNPLAATNFDSNGNPFQFATAIAFLAGTAPFEPFAGGGARLAYMEDFGFTQNDIFVSIISPVPEPSSAALLLIGAATCLRSAWRRGKNVSS